LLLLSASCALALRAQPAVAHAETSTTAADEAWKALEALPTRPPPGLTKSETEAWPVKNLYGVYTQTALRFYESFPRDPRHWDAAYSYAAYMINFSGIARAEEMARAKALVQEIVAAPDAPESLKERAAFKLITYELSSESNPGIRQLDLKQIKQKADDFVTRFPAAENRLSWVEQYYVNLLRERDPAAADERLRADLASANPQIVAMAKGKLAVSDAAKVPFELKFTAVDGREVDLVKLRGKVVLIDFWATWCGPCIAELPNVQQAYAAYHDRGFEVVGISLDTAKAREKLLEFVKTHGVPWPQYFDGKVWENEIARKYAVRSIPATFLLDQSGKVVSTEARGPVLEAEVKRLLKL
jgi:thiol-disulfide isomerase/thioredoxin